MVLLRGIPRDQAVPSRGAARPIYPSARVSQRLPVQLARHGYAVAVLRAVRAWDLQRAFYAGARERGVRGDPAPGRGQPVRGGGVSRGSWSASCATARVARAGPRPSHCTSSSLGAGAGRFAHGFVRELAARTDCAAVAAAADRVRADRPRRARARGVGGPSRRSRTRGSTSRASTSRRTARLRCAARGATLTGSAEPARRDRQPPVRQRARGRVRDRRRCAGGVPAGGRGRRRPVDGADVVARPTGRCRPLRRRRTSTGCSSTTEHAARHGGHGPARRDRSASPAGRAAPATGCSCSLGTRRTARRPSLAPPPGARAQTCTAAASR